MTKSVVCRDCALRKVNDPPLDIQSYRDCAMTKGLWALETDAHALPQHFRATDGENTIRNRAFSARSRDRM